MADPLDPEVLKGFTQFFDRADMLNREMMRMPSVTEDQMPISQYPKQGGFIRELIPRNAPPIKEMPTNLPSKRNPEQAQFRGNAADVVRSIWEATKNIPQAPAGSERKEGTTGEKVGKEIGGIADLALLLMSLGALGSVRSGQRVGPARFQKLYDYVMKNKELIPDQMFSTTEQKISKIGRGVEGDVYRIGNVTMKTSSSGDPFEAESTYRLRGQPGFKKFLGTVSEARKDLPGPSKHSEIMDYISKGEVNPEDVGMLGLFTRFEPKMERFRTFGSSQVPNLDMLKEIVSALQRSGISLTDLHRGNVPYRRTPTGLSEPSVLDLGLSNLVRKPGQTSDLYFREEQKNTSSIMLDRILSHLINAPGGVPEKLESIKKTLMKSKLSKGGEK